MNPIRTLSRRFVVRWLVAASIIASLGVTAALKPDDERPTPRAAARAAAPAPTHGALAVDAPTVGDALAVVAPKPAAKAAGDCETPDTRPAVNPPPGWAAYRPAFAGFAHLVLRHPSAWTVDESEAQILLGAQDGAAVVVTSMSNTGLPEDSFDGLIDAVRSRLPSSFTVDSSFAAKVDGRRACRVSVTVPGGRAELVAVDAGDTVVLMAVALPDAASEASRNDAIRVATGLRFVS